MQITAAEFKAKCLNIMNHVNDYHEEIIITKRGKPVAKLVPYSSEPKKPLFGYLKGTVQEHDDITKPVDEIWEADQ